MVEMAVFGAIALAALGFLIRVGMTLNYGQEIRMGAFRRALHAAHSDNAAVSGVPGQDAVGVLYHYIAHRQLPETEEGFAAMPRVRTASDAYVEWGDQLTYAFGDGSPATPAGRNTQEWIIVRSDGTIVDLRAEDLPTDANAGFAQTATRGLVSEWTTTNSSLGGIQQSHDGSGNLTTTASTTTTGGGTTTLNTIRGPGSIASSVSTTNTHAYTSRPWD